MKGLKHKTFMEIALEEAKTAFEAGEIPVGAVLVQDGEIIARTHNLVETEENPGRHAEMIAMGIASEESGNKYLTGATLYCTLEPCPMCAGAAVLYRLERIVFGARDPVWGACGTVFNIPLDRHLNHHPQVIGGIMEEECGKIVKDFFNKIRQ
jgi:tRNA(adenine34) deaminase